MKLIGAISTAVLSLSIGIGIPAYAQQEQHEQQEENKDKPAQEKEKKAQPEKSAKPEEQNAKQEEKKAQQENVRQEKNVQEQHAQQTKPEQKEEHAGGGRIPADRFKAHFGREHSFRVSAGDYRNHRFQYGGYWFGFASEWPSNWLYTQDVYVVEIDGVYYLCNASYPGVNLTLEVTL